jgi:Fic family protein
MENQNQKNLISSQNQNNSIVKDDIGVLFAGDSYGLFVFQKTDKLVKAIYLLTGLMSDKEPMRERSRALANKMLENALAMSERIWGEEIYQKNLLSAISEVSVLFDIAENTKMMSKMNHQIITSELQKLADFLITSSANYSSAKIAFEPNLFDGDYNYVPEQTFQSISPSQNQNIIKNDSVKDTNYSNKGQNEVLAGNINNKANEKMSYTKTVVPEKTVKDKNSRQDIILSMLKSGVKLTIKDFAKNIKDCSDKTIQRELSALVSKGVLKKEGERRWSKYFIVK